MAKRLTAKEKQEITQNFKMGKNIEFLAEEFNCSKLTIIRNLKRDLGDKSYKEFIKKDKKLNPIISNDKNINTESSLKLSNNDYEEKEFLDKKEYENIVLPVSEFIEIAPLNFEIENAPRKEFSSIPIGEIEFPKTVYMIVNKNIELEIKSLKDYPEWEFLPNEDLKRKTIEIYFDLKKAKRHCSNEQKVIKVPNPDVFRIVSPILISKGISRIVSEDKLIAL